MSSTVLDRAAILGLSVVATVQPIDLPGLGRVHVRTMTGAERDRFEETQRTVKLANFRGRFAAAVLCDAEGGRLFDDSDAGALGALPSTVLDKVYDAGSKLNGIGNDHAEAAEKN